MAEQSQASGAVRRVGLVHGLGGRHGADPSKLQRLPIGRLEANPESARRLASEMTRLMAAQMHRPTAVQALAETAAATLQRFAPWQREQALQTLLVAIHAEMDRSERPRRA